MLLTLKVFLLASLGGAGFWLRGSALFHELTGRGATTARLVAWSIPMSLVSWLVGVHHYAALALVLAFWAGAVLPWWSSIDMGRYEGTWRKDALMQSLRGVCWVLPVAMVLALAGHDWWWVLASGLVCAPAYEIGHRVWPKRGTEIGEALFGAAVGASVGVAI